MKTKYSVIPFIPAVIAAIGLKIMSMFAVDGNGLLFGMNKSGINYFIIEIILGLFAVCVLINLFDRKTAPVYPVKKNFVSGAFAVISGIAIVGSSFLALINATPDNTDNYLLSIIAALFSIPAAIAMIMIGKVHFSGKSIVSNVSMFFVFPALWGCSELVSEFLAATKVSISASDMTPLFCYIFITLYLFSSSMVVSRVKGRNPVKACFIYVIVCNFIFGTQLDIQFSGGATLKFSYSGEINQSELTDFIQVETTEDRITTTYAQDLMGDSGTTVTVQFSGNDSIKTDIQKNLESDLQKKYPDNNFKCLESNSVDASMGFSFLLKCLTAVAIAAVLMVLYVTIRFKKIGGLSAGVMALVALFHDVAMIYFMYVIFQMPIDASFIAVVLMILGYSLNDTIVIYDRVREEKKLVGSKTDVGKIFNLSCTKCIKRTIMTSVTTLSAILVVYVVACAFNITSVQGFALPMIIGIISGCYSSICIAGPLWVMWQRHKKAKKLAAKAA